MLLNHDLTSISVEADATALPRGFEVDISGVEVGTTIYVRDVKVPDDVTVVTDGDALVVSGLAAPTAEQLDAELAEAEAEAGAGQVSGGGAERGEGERRGGAPTEQQSAEQPAEA